MAAGSAARQSVAKWQVVCRWRRLPLVGAAVILWAGVGQVKAEAQVEVEFVDGRLQAKIHEALGLRTGDPVTVDELAKLTRLDASGLNIESLAGLEGATNLTALNLSHNEISDVAPLAEHPSLQTLNLSRNRIVDLSTLSGLPRLRTLELAGNSIQDISPLAGLAGLVTLDLQDNAVTDVDALQHLNELRVLILKSNRIVNLAPLVSNPGIGTGDTVQVEHNCLDLTAGSENQEAVKALLHRNVALNRGNQRPDCR